MHRLDLLLVPESRDAEMATPDTILPFAILKNVHGMQIKTSQFA